MHNKYYSLGSLGYLIALISDIHFYEKYNLEIFSKIIANLKKHQPDYICITGDILDTANVLDSPMIEELKKFIINLSHISTVVITIGNHELYDYKYKKVDNFEKVNNWFLELNTIENVYYLYNKSLIRDNICFTALNNSYEYYSDKENIKTFIEEVNNNVFLNKKYYNILLCHSPYNILKDETIENCKELKKVDLVLSGHMHNGLVFKLLDHGGSMGFIGPKKEFSPKHARNKVTKDDITLIINGGTIKLADYGTGILKHFNFLYPIEIDYIRI